jgi:hypothetical protein
MNKKRMSRLIELDVGWSTSDKEFDVESVKTGLLRSDLQNGRTNTLVYEIRVTLRCATFDKIAQSK